VSESDLQRRLDQASREVERLRAENERLRTLLGLSQRVPSIHTAAEINGRVPVPARRPRSLEFVTGREGRADPESLSWP